MKLGILTSIFDGWSFEEVLDIAQNKGLNVLKLPAGRKEKRRGAMQESVILMWKG